MPLTLLTPDDYPGTNPIPGTTPSHPRDGAPALPLHRPDGSERRILTPKDAASQLLDIYDDVVAASDDMRILLQMEIAQDNGGPSARFCKDMLCHCQELIAIAHDLEDVCDDLVPGAPQARTYSAVSCLKDFRLAL